MCAHRTLKGLADFRWPHEWWPRARSLKRELIYHMGPTNSGKTFESLEHLKRSTRGIYVSPLRLLAAEVYEKLTVQGVPCSLITGQEKILTPGAQHIACTIETADFSGTYDVAVIDEVQMLEDSERGSAWTNALLGLPAKHLHLTGDPRARKIVRSLAADTRENLKEYTYERFSPLVVDKTVASLSDLRPGDCIVAFSRKTCHWLRKYIESHSAGGCAIIYGNLPPNTRKEQARKFNERGEAHYLVATDAIGLGVNYQIDRVVFFETFKNDGQRVRRLFPFEVRQIAGRAGRYRVPGQVTAFCQSDLRFITNCLSSNTGQTIKRAALFPSFEQIEEFASEFPEKTPYSQILLNLAVQAELGKNYFLQNVDAACMIANRIASLSLSLQDTYTFSHSPTRLQVPGSLFLLHKFAQSFSESGKVQLQLPLLSPQSSLEDLEKRYFTLELYLWLANKYHSSVFKDAEQAKVQISQCVTLIEEQLDLSQSSINE